MSIFKRLKKALGVGAHKDVNETIAELMSVINILQLRAKELERRAFASREKAKHFLKIGNKSLAQQHLKRYIRYSKYLERYYKFTANLEDAIMEIKTAEDISKLEDAMQKASTLLERSRNLISPERAMEVMERMQTRFEEIDVASEILSEGFEFAGEEQELQREFEKLEAEIALEQLPQVSAVEKEKVPVEEELKEEIEKLKAEDEEKEKE